MYPILQHGSAIGAQALKFGYRYKVGPEVGFTERRRGAGGRVGVGWVWPGSRRSYDDCNASAHCGDGRGGAGITASGVYLCNLRFDLALLANGWEVGWWRWGGGGWEGVIAVDEAVSMRSSTSLSQQKQ